MGLIKEWWDGGDKVANAKAEKENSFGMASCVIAVVFEDAIAQGKTDEDLQQVYKDVGRRFMGQRR